MKEQPLKGQLIEPLSGSLLGDVYLDRGDEDVKNNVLITVSSAEGTKTVLITPESIVETSPKHFVETPKERVVSGTERWMKKVGRYSTVATYLFAALLLTFSAASVTGYVKARVVLTNSMEPTINPGDIVITADSNRVVPQIGSIIAYQARQFNGTPVGVFTHRIVGGNALDGWLMKGDNNPSPDIQKPKGADILGTVILTIPKLGLLFNRRLLFTLIPLLVGLWFVIDTLKGGAND
ncbi:sigpep_I_arch, signal peptidase I [Candidatus Nanopelagicaceae bacterium]